jgi:hypothetical protein
VLPPQLGVAPKRKTLHVDAGMHQVDFARRREPLLGRYGIARLSDDCVGRQSSG